MREKDVEAYLVKSVNASGGLCWKWTSPNLAGVPDRICIFPSGSVVFVEVKATGKKPRAMQTKRMLQLGAVKANVHWLDSPSQIDILIEEYT